MPVEGKTISMADSMAGNALPNKMWSAFDVCQNYLLQLSVKGPKTYLTGG